MKIFKALTIAGSDSCGGAGIQADLKTFLANGVYGMSAVTALTAQNTFGVRAIMNVTPKFLSEQLDAIFEDIVPDATKVGMISSAGLAEIIAYKLKNFNARNVIIDPVMIATSGAKLIEDDAIKILEEKLFPLATLITPNLPELEILTDERISTLKDMEIVSQKLFNKFGCAVLAKGGHGFNNANDFLFDGNGEWFCGKHIETNETHGTGCTLSSAIAANLAKKYVLRESIRRAKDYLTDVLEKRLDFGNGSNLLNHGCNLNYNEFTK